ncbi:MAG: VOC family protein [Pseudomonadota bacterium]
MIDHSGFTVSDISRSKAYYKLALAPIDYSLLMEFPAAITGTTDVAGFGEPDKPDFWLSQATPAKPAHSPALHFAFAAANRAQVDAYYTAAIAAGGQDNGAPGLRPHYHPNYYGAFVLDPDGHNIEVVCHQAE